MEVYAGIFIIWALSFIVLEFMFSLDGGSFFDLEPLTRADDLILLLFCTVLAPLALAVALIYKIAEIIKERKERI